MIGKFRLCSTAFLFLFISIPVFAQDAEEEEPEYEKVEYYTLGDQTFSINAGLFFPLFYHDPTPAGDSAIADTNLGLGGTGSIAYDAYLNNNIKLGLEVGGMFAFSPNDNAFGMVPITARGTYEFHFGQFSLPLYLGAGINIITYQENVNVQFLLKPGISFYWNFNSDWSFGANLVYWWSPEIIFEDHTHDRIGNFLDFTLSAQYHF